MNLLIVSATNFEIDPLVRIMLPGIDVGNNLQRYSYRGLQIDILITGVGMVPATYFVTKALQQFRYDWVLNAGICGSFRRDLELGAVLNVTSECLPETGAEAPGSFLSLSELGLIRRDEFPYTEERLLNPTDFSGRVISGLKMVRGATVNTIHGDPGSVRLIQNRMPVEVESMEGAAVFYPCLLEGIKFLEIRAISNYVEPRNVNAWNIPLAISNLNEFLIKYLEELSLPR